MDNIFSLIEGLPESPGCYFFKNKNDEIIYIGKSKNLKKRVKSYFGVVKHPKIKRLVKEISFIEFQITDSESDALFLECFLIKKHCPKYNSMLKKDKQFPYIKIDCSKAYPTIKIDYEQTESCYGFFYSENDALRTIELIGDVWKTPVCGQAVFRNKRECLRYHLGKCYAPCTEKADITLYNNAVKEIICFFNSKHKKIFGSLNKELKICVKNLEFEKAEKIHKNIEKLNLLSKKIKRINTSFNKKNLYLLYRAFNEKELSIFYVDGGEISSRFIIDTEDINYDLIHKYISERENMNLNPKFLTINHLLEIVADKYFVEDKRGIDLDKKAKYLQEKINEFLSLC